MRSRSFEDYGVAIEFINEQPIAGQMAFSTTLIVANEFVIS